LSWQDRKNNKFVKSKKDCKLNKRWTFDEKHYIP